ncbi:hybrid sensor histidine kinase/response regulator [Leptolyngbya sp. AN03gr2]|uniref:hybrid sensor histidine kinase/response regulator n=1 Tax=unclassified Leptolyngbya TaxID=2650499 RepID=UPI003D316282
MQINLATVNFVNIVVAALNIVRPLAEAKHIQLNSYLPTVLQVSGDFNRLQQMVVNLLTNAIKFTPEYGRVEVELVQVADYLQLCIRDTGKGIAPEFLPLIFERYQQGQPNTGSKDGLGLGLAIVKHLIDLHSGTITAESQGEGQGATFTVRLPLLDASTEGLDDSSRTEINSLDGIRILVVDDEPDQVDLLVFVLEEAGAIVRSANRGNSALPLISQFQPDILISDIAMPDQNGYELLRQVRALDSGQNIPAIALTAHASVAHREDSLQAGFAYHLVKPVEPEEVVRRILSVIQRRAG